MPEPERLGPGKYRQPRLAADGLRRRNLEPEQHGQRGYTRRERGGRPSVAEALRAHASVICLQHPSLPPLSGTEQVSLKKKKVSSTVPFVSGRKPDTEETSKQKKL